MSNRKPPASPNSEPPNPAPDLARAQQLVLELMAIPGKSGEEAAVAEYIRGKLLAAGAPADAIITDNANKHALIKGNTGNLIFKLPGTMKGPAADALGPHGHRADLRRLAAEGRRRIRPLGQSSDRPGRPTTAPARRRFSPRPWKSWSTSCRIRR